MVAKKLTPLSIIDITVVKIGIGVLSSIRTSVALLNLTMNLQFSYSANRESVLDCAKCTVQCKVDNQSWTKSVIVFSLMKIPYKFTIMSCELLPTLYRYMFTV